MQPEGQGQGQDHTWCGLALSYGSVISAARTLRRLPARGLHHLQGSHSPAQSLQLKPSSAPSCLSMGKTSYGQEAQNSEPRADSGAQSLVLSPAGQWSCRQKAGFGVSVPGVLVT